MSNARNNFVMQLKHLRDAALEPATVQGPPTASEHNARSQLLRNGLCVTGFVVLESFLKHRVAEVVSHIDPSKILFSQLPLRLKEIALLESTKALHTQARRSKSRGEDHLAFIQNNISPIASSTETAYKLSPLLFGNCNSNINSDDIGGVLGAVGIRSPWTAMQKLCLRVGLGAPGLKDSFEDLAQRRHAAAHDPTAGTTTSDLNDLEMIALSVAISFDFLLTTAMHMIEANDARILAGDKIDMDTMITLRTVAQDGSQFVHRVETRSASVSKHADAAAARLSAFAAGKSNTNPVVVLGPRSTPIDWDTPFFSP